MDEFLYGGNDLGANYFKEYTLFKVWSPGAQGMKVVLYNGYDDPGDVHEMLRGRDGIWEIRIEGDHKNKYYNYRVTINDIERETPDPYTKGASINGLMGMIVDFKSINPEGWEHHLVPRIKSTEGIIYEIHLRDFSIHEHSGMKFKGKYLAFTEKGIKGEGGVSTGIDHLKELGITHVHLLPVFDFGSVNEACEEEYNWGYDPCLYNVPEGSYGTNPYDGTIRISELKKMIMALHENNMGVVMDVVFNHTFKIGDTPFDILVPGYYYRFNQDGSYGNGSGCGNEIASEKPMVRKFIVDSVKFWATEYKIDGFRFDLMGLMDIGTMDEIEKQLKKINPNILIYGEPWTGGASPLDDHLQFRKGSQRGMNIGVFNDGFRNAIKGDNDGIGLGFVNGGDGLEIEIKKGILGSIHYNNDLWGFAKEPRESINYVSSHDNLTLFDKMIKTNPNATDKEREQMNRLALSIILTSHGIPFIHGGSEILRSKRGNHNSYCAGDAVNKIDWNRKRQYYETYLYVQGLIAIRKSQRVMTMDKSEDIVKYLGFIDTPKNVVAYLLNSPFKDDYRHIFIVHNGNREQINIKLPYTGGWKILANGIEANPLGVWGGNTHYSSEIEVAPRSTYILVQ